MRTTDSVSAKKKKAVAAPVNQTPRRLNPEYTNPIYFGYTSETVVEHDRKVANEKAALKARENR
ncbi:hypothetical protein ACX0FG_16180, partial [Enterococcus faecium]